MFTYETADRNEVRRFRIAQFNGRAATVRNGENTVTGQVRSVLERQESLRLPPVRLFREGVEQKGGGGHERNPQMTNRR